MKISKKFFSVLLLLTMFLSLSACGKDEDKTSLETPSESVSSDEKWDKEVDICIVGYGLAGAAAAVEANDIDPEAEILILEKMPIEAAGGNSIASGQTFIVPQKEDIETFKSYMKACNEPNPIPEDYLDWWSNEMADQIGWIVETMDSVNY
ncbi:MAG: hypothetical protein GX752_05050, partial [Clostridium sp.]|nr:hypothetical protein [Clostridium sp.]